MKVSMKAAMLIPAFMAIVACASKEDSKQTETTQINVGDIMKDTSLSSSAKAEKLAKASEQLLTGQGFVYADTVAGMALQIDEKNVRAQFVKALLAPVMAHKGMIARVRPLTKIDGEAQEAYEKEMKKLDKTLPNSSARTFLQDGPENIKNEADVQEYLDSVAAGFAKLREFAKNNKSAELTIMASDTFLGSLKQKYEECSWDQTTWNYTCEIPKNAFEIKLNRADFEGLQQMAAGLELYVSLANSYELASVFEVMKAHKYDTESGEHASADQLYQELMRDPKFATLRKGNGFQKVKEMGADGIAAIRWVIENKKELCPQGPQATNRVGALFSQGFCVANPKATLKDLKTVENVLAGDLIDAHFHKDLPWYVDPNLHKSYKTRVKPVAIIEKPIQNLRDLGNLEFNDCNQVVSVAEPTLGGLFPKGDANKALDTAASCFQSPY